MNKKEGVWVNAADRLPVGKAPAANTKTGEVGFLRIDKEEAVMAINGVDTYYYRYDDANSYNNFRWLDTTKNT